MSNQVNAMLIIQARRSILTRLNIMYPTPITCQSLFNAMNHINPAYDKSYFKKDIYYFKDKGWVRFIDDKIGGMDNFDTKVVVLTADGKEIAEGTDSDKALEL